MALLSSTLAYQHSFKNKFEYVPIIPSDTPAAAPPTNQKIKPDPNPPINVAAQEKQEVKVAVQVPKVIYCTRTHSQLQQVVNEFRNCHPLYTQEPNMCVLGARMHLCINNRARDDAKKGKGLDEVCKELRENFKCRFARKKQKVTATAHALTEKGIWDIEDAIEAGKAHMGCPYFATREVFEHSTYIFCPYSYLLDPGIRKAMKMPLRNAVVIFDEAHNIEDIARDGASIDVLPRDFELAIFELGRVNKHYGGGGEGVGVANGGNMGGYLGSAIGKSRFLSAKAVLLRIMSLYGKGSASHRRLWLQRSARQHAPVLCGFRAE
ncbi:hypothetical protein EON65_15955 [archaeon]|nr:MAG: hypothetical protein EON65_15955 [archaeon]